MADGAPVMALDGGSIGFVQVPDGRGDGLAAVTIRVSEVEPVLREAGARGLDCGPAHFVLAGTRFDLVE